MGGGGGWIRFRFLREVWNVRLHLITGILDVGGAYVSAFFLGIVNAEFRRMEACLD